MANITAQQHWIHTEGGQLFAQSWAPAAEKGSAIVLLHDSLGCVQLWRDFPERLARATGRKVIAYDRLGFGLSDPHHGVLSTSFIEDEVVNGFRAVAEQLNLKEFALLGHSVGGGMAVGCAAAFPGGCEALITESAQAFVDADIVRGIQSARVHFANHEQLGPVNTNCAATVFQQ